jgi:hypothetical protein
MAMLDFMPPLEVARHRRPRASFFPPLLAVEKYSTVQRRRWGRSTQHKDPTPPPAAFTTLGRPSRFCVVQCPAKKTKILSTARRGVVHPFVPCISAKGREGNPVQAHPRLFSRGLHPSPGYPSCQQHRRRFQAESTCPKHTRVHPATIYEYHFSRALLLRFCASAPLRPLNGRSAKFLLHSAHRASPYAPSRPKVQVNLAAGGDIADAIPSYTRTPSRSILQW